MLVATNDNPSFVPAHFAIGVPLQPFKSAANLALSTDASC